MDRLEHTGLVVDPSCEHRGSRVVDDILRACERQYDLAREALYRSIIREIPHGFDPSYATGPGESERCVCGRPLRDGAHIDVCAGCGAYPVAHDRGPFWRGEPVYRVWCSACVSDGRVTLEGGDVHDA